MRKYFSEEFLSLTKGHKNYQFVDIAVNDDTKLFIDPCLIQLGNDEWCRKAAETIMSFMDVLIRSFESQNDKEIETLLSHAGEQNATKLGYGKGDNGSGHTARGLAEILLPMKQFVTKIETISRPEDLTLFISGFAEDGLSDLLTNILHNQLNQFTSNVLKNYNLSCNDETSYFFWDLNSQSWVKTKAKCFSYQNKEILLVPKKIVRKKYLFNVDQFFRRIILERIRNQDKYRDINGNPMSKNDIIDSKRYSREHWMYEESIEYTIKNNDALSEYHEKLSYFYIERGVGMSDDELDRVVYG